MPDEEYMGQSLDDFEGESEPTDPEETEATPEPESTEVEEPTPEEGQSEEPTVEVPEKFLGETAEETISKLVPAYSELELELGRLRNEVGTLRKEANTKENLYDYFQEETEPVEPQVAAPQETIPEQTVPMDIVSKIESKLQKLNQDGQMTTSEIAKFYAESMVEISQTQTKQVIENMLAEAAATQRIQQLNEFGQQHPELVSNPEAVQTFKTYVENYGLPFDKALALATMEHKLEAAKVEGATKEAQRQALAKKATGIKPLSQKAESNTNNTPEDWIVNGFPTGEDNFF